uniref:Uncharacterized protein n=1 Tax=Cacopsylla melanoneura TaxID=428564 RepID=A0A8D8SGR3_9HEMI
MANITNLILRSLCVILKFKFSASSRLYFKFCTSHSSLWNTITPPPFLLILHLHIWVKFLNWYASASSVLTFTSVSMRRSSFGKTFLIFTISRSQFNFRLRMFIWSTDNSRFWFKVCCHSTILSRDSQLGCTLCIHLNKFELLFRFIK